MDVQITTQGAPIINNIHIIKSSQDLAAIEIDLKSKYCKVVSYFSGSEGQVGIWIGSDERSLYLNNNVDRNIATVIEFPQFKGWTVWAATIGRYTCQVCLIKL